VECGQIFHEILILGRSLDGEPAFGRHGEWAARGGRLQLRTRRTGASHFRWRLMDETTGASRALSHFTLGTTCDWRRDE
jgi:hypothetical protein